MLQTIKESENKQDKNYNSNCYRFILKNKTLHFRNIASRSHPAIQKYCTVTIETGQAVD